MSLSDSCRALLRSPALDSTLPEEDVYRAACIGAVTLLFETADVEGLRETVLSAAAPESRERALFALYSLTRRSNPAQEAAIDGLLLLALRENHPGAAAILKKETLSSRDPGLNSAVLLFLRKKHQLLKQDPGVEKLTEFFLNADESLRERLLTLAEHDLPDWAILMHCLVHPDKETREALMKAYGSFAPDLRQLLRFSLREGLPEGARNLAADLFLKEADGTALELCLSHRLLPTDSAHHALFYFLSGQWENYYASDRDYRRICAAYELKDPELQRRLIAAGRESGNIGWLRDVASGEESQASGGRRLTDQWLLIREYAAQKRYVRLWELLPAAPLLYLPEIVSLLEAAGFVPETAEEQGFFKEIREKVHSCGEMVPLPLVREFFPGSGTAQQLCCGGPYLAAVFADRKVRFWDTREEAGAPFELSYADVPFRMIRMDASGSYLLADCGDNQLRVFSLPAGQAVKTVKGSGTLCGLFIQADGRRFITLDRQGKGGIFTFPGGMELYRFDSGLRDCFRAAYDPELNRIYAMSTEGGCAVFDIAQRQLVTTLALGGDVLAASEHSSRSRVSFLGKNARLSTVHVLSGKGLFSAEGSVGLDGARRLLEMDEGELFALGTQDGQVRIFDPASLRAAAAISCGGKSAVSGLCLAPDGSRVYACCANGTVRGWDLTLFRWFCASFSLPDLPGLNRVEDYCKQYPQPEVRAAGELLKAVIQWRRRFDIEVDFEIE